MLWSVYKRVESLPDDKLFLCALCANVYEVIKYCYGHSGTINCRVYQTEVSRFNHRIHMGPHGSKTFNMLLLPQVFQSCQTSPEFSFQWSSQKYCFGFFEILSFWNVTNLWNSPLYPMGKPKTSIIWKTSDCRAKRSNIGPRRWVFSVYMVFMTGG